MYSAPKDLYLLSVLFCGVRHLDGLELLGIRHDFLATPLVTMLVGCVTSNFVYFCALITAKRYYQSL